MLSDTAIVANLIAGPILLLVGTFITVYFRRVHKWALDSEAFVLGRKASARLGRLQHPVGIVLVGVIATGMGAVALTYAIVALMYR
jgi:hypothetical protein